MKYGTVDDYGGDGGQEKIFSTKSQPAEDGMHLREAKPYKCGQCTKAFANSSYLSQHTRIHLGIKPYRCEICQRKFTQLSHLQQHVRTHTGDKPYKCRQPGCTKAFSQLSNLQSHSRCHATDRPFKCNSCYKCFTDESSLLDHIPKHKESKHLKTHICPHCGKSYTQETYLGKHMEKHDGSGGKGGKRKKAPAQQIQMQQPLQQPEPQPPAADYQWKTEMEDSSIAAAAAVADLRVHYDGLIKNGASAFTPTNTYILHSATNGSSSPPLQQEPPTTTRYIQYDPFKPTPQLISLHQIRNYSELKEKIVEMGGQ